MKRTLASLMPIGLVFSATAYAAAPPVEMPVYEEHDRFVIGFEKHFYKPHQTDLYYTFTVDADGNEKVHYLNPDFDFSGGRVFASYMFTNENDIQISWTHMDANDKDHTNVAAADVASWGVGLPFESFQGNLVNLEDVELKKSQSMDIVDLDMGRVFHDEDYMIRIFAGVRYAMIDDELKFTSFDGTDHEYTKGESQLDGVGARGGFDARYRLMEHVSITGHAAVALLKGYIDAKTTFVPNGSDSTTAKTDEIEALVPNMDARLGLAVDFMFDNGWGLVIEGGFHGEHFFNASAVALSGGGVVNRDVSAYGPYVGAAVMFS